MRKGITGSRSDQFARCIVKDPSAKFAGLVTATRRRFSLICDRCWKKFARSPGELAQLPTHTPRRRFVSAKTTVNAIAE